MYPALAVLEQLPSATLNLLWVGGEGGMEEELVRRAGAPFRAIAAAGVHGVGLRALPGNLLKLLRGAMQARKILRDFKPQVILFTGGYVAAPMALAAWKIPSLLYVPDIEPGLALKFLSYFANLIALTAPDSEKYFPRRSRFIVSGYPLRADLQQWTRPQAARRFELDAAAPTLLVTGGSKGARSINQAVLRCLPDLLSFTQVIHLTGALDWEECQQAAQSLPVDLKPRYRAMPYLHEMGAALAAADLVVSRAGASTLGEYPLFGLPAILVPYPYAWRYQKVNADFLVERRAAWILKDEALETEMLTTVKTLLLDKEKLAAMRAAMQSLARPAAAQEIASQLVKLAGDAPL